jgi:hypothetical protein
LLTEIKDTTDALVKQIKWRIEDCETLVRSRITEDYVQDLGKSIERGIIDTVSTFLLTNICV